MLTARYRRDYDGEFVVTETRWTGGKKIQNREWVPNPIVNQHISGRAACIVSDYDKYNTDQNAFDYRWLQRHRGGLLGSKKLQTYGVGPITQEMRLDFAVDTRAEVLSEILERKYQESNVVYTTTRMCLLNPGEFYLIPFNPMLSLEALPLYLACFDGHSEVFVLGANQDYAGSNSAWIEQVGQVMSAYREVKFYMIGIRKTMPTVWFEHANVDAMTYREWISFCDI